MQKLPDTPDADAVNFFHLNSDRDAGPGALHHTLGLGQNQASAGNHRHNGRDAYRVDFYDLKNAPDFTPVAVEYTPQGGAVTTQPTFNGAPLFSGMYVKFGDLVHFEIQADFDNITNFGTGQYYMTLPFPARVPYDVRQGCLHDISGGDQYTISGHVNANSTQLMLFSTASNGRDVPFESNVPVNLDIADNFHISGSYIAK
jgi:hypothetical protein